MYLGRRAADISPGRSVLAAAVAADGCRSDGKGCELAGEAARSSVPVAQLSWMPGTLQVCFDCRHEPECRQAGRPPPSLRIVAEPTARAAGLPERRRDPAFQASYLRSYPDRPAGLRLPDRVFC